MDVGNRWLRHPGGMVVGEDDRCGVAFEGCLGNLPGRHVGPVHGAEEQLFKAEHAVARIEEQAPEDFPFDARIGPHQEHRGVVGATEGGLLLHAAGRVAGRDRQHRLEAGHPGRPEAGVAEQLPRRRVQHPMHGAELVEQAVGHVDGAGVGRTAAQQHRQQIGVAECVLLGGQQPLPAGSKLPGLVGGAPFAGSRSIHSRSIAAKMQACRLPENTFCLG